MSLQAKMWDGTESNLPLWVREHLFQRHLLIYNEYACIEDRCKNTRHASWSLNQALS